MSTRILLADDHELLRQGLRLLIEKQPDMEVAGEAEDGRKALELALRLVPDIVVMDVSMPNLSGVEATREIVRELPGIKVIALSIHSDRPFVDDMLKAGASGYILKESAFDELLRGIEVVLAGEMYLSPKVTRIVVNKPELGIDSLTDRERQVIRLLWEERNTKQIALKLHVSPKTIEAAIRKIKDKLVVDSVTGIIKKAIQEKVISAEV